MKSKISCGYCKHYFSCIKKEVVESRYVERIAFDLLCLENNRLRNALEIEKKRCKNNHKKF